MNLKTTTIDLLSLLNFQIENKCSDLHIMAQTKPYFRHPSKKIVPAENQPEASEKDIEIIAKEILGPKYDIFLKEREANQVSDIEDIGRFRINLHFSYLGMGIDFRQISKNLPTVEELEIPEMILEKMFIPNGLILLTGQNDAGKTTLLTALLNHINQKKEAHIVTIEDPIEYIHPNIKSFFTQREIGYHSNSFTNAMTEVLRQDVDVVAIGEMRNLETINTALTLAETGYLVIATLHTIDAVQSIERILDVFPRERSAEVRTQLSLVLQCVVSNKLLPNTTHTDRVAAREIMIPTDAIRNLIRLGKTERIYSEMQISRKYGNILFDDYLKVLYTKKLIDKDTLIREAHFPELIEKRFSAE